MSEAPAGGRIVVVDVGRRFVIVPLVLLAHLLVPMDGRGVVVLVLVIGGSMLELAERATRVVVRDVVVVVGVEHRDMRVFVLDIAGYSLGRLLHDAPPC